MTPTPEQIEAARAWLEECHMTFGSAVLNVAMAELAATYAAHCVAEEMKEKDLCGKLEINKLNRTIAALVEFVPDNVISDEVKFAKQRVTELFLEKDAEIARLRDALKPLYVLNLGSSVPPENMYLWTMRGPTGLLASISKADILNAVDVLQDAVDAGVGVMRGGEHVPVEDFYKTADELKEEKKP